MCTLYIHNLCILCYEATQFYFTKNKNCGMLKLRIQQTTAKHATIQAENFDYEVSPITLGHIYRHASNYL